MRVLITKTSSPWGEGEVKEFSDMKDCIETLFKTEDFGRFEPELVISKADDLTPEKGGVECEYEIEIYDDYRE